MKLFLWLLPALWPGLLLLPNITTLSLANAWEAPSWQLAATSMWMIVFAWMLLPRRVFLVASLPFALAGIAIIAADALYSANLLELIAVRYTFRESEIAQALRPHVLSMALAVAAVLVLLALSWRTRTHGRVDARFVAAGALIGGVLAFTLPSASWRNAWPADVVGAALEGHIADTGIPLPTTEDIRGNPRNRFASWQASASRRTAAVETYVFVIGESIRSDRLPECGGRPQITAAPKGAIVFCNVLSGSSSTHTSVPLLISRSLPGSRERVPRDATVLKAFEEAGFETFWFAVQDRMIAWPDARNQAFEPTPGLDRDILLPLLDRALSRPSPRKLIVLHAYNAHAPYHERYRAATAPFPRAAESAAQGVPTRDTIDQWWNEYDNAVDETIRFLGEVTSRLQAQQGASFLLFTPDHGENMLDDARDLTYHALKTPTIWDTSVPGLLWSNETWRDANPRKWSMLEQNRNAALMHMDFVPTLLGAAGIEYQDTRTQPVDITARAVAPRERFTQVRAGEIVSFEVMRKDAQAQARR